MPDLSIERTYSGRVAGVDEVGRGPWAGPVVAAAVVLRTEMLPDGINDSKKLSPQKRAYFYDILMSIADIGIGHSTVEEIDALNILQATKLAMERAIAALPYMPDAILVDGNQAFNASCTVQPIVKGDSISLSIASASIIAKVTRDNYMAELAKQFPHYGWEKNVGYGTKLHQEGMVSHGITLHHRRSFKPVLQYARVCETA